MHCMHQRSVSRQRRINRALSHNLATQHVLLFKVDTEKHNKRFITAVCDLNWAMISYEHILPHLFKCVTYSHWFLSQTLTGFTTPASGVYDVSPRKLGVPPFRLTLQTRWFVPCWFAVDGLHSPHHVGSLSSFTFLSFLDLLRCSVDRRGADYFSE